MPYFVAIFEMVDREKDKEILDVHIDFLNQNIKKKGTFTRRVLSWITLVVS